MRVALLPEAGKLHSCSLSLSTATVMVDNSTLRADGEESDGAGLPDCSVSVGETHWVRWMRVQGILLVML